MRFNRRRVWFGMGAAILLTLGCETARLVDDSGELWTDISPKTAVLRAVGATLQLGVVNAAGAPVIVPGLTWRVLEANIIQVDGSGRVTAIAPGVSHLVAEAGNVADTATIEVRQDVAVVTVSPIAATIGISGTQQFTAALRDANGHAITGRAVTWASGNTSFATVNGSGLATGVAAGATSITATSDGMSGVAALTVTAGPPPPPPPPVASVTVTPPSASITTGSTVQLSATLRDAGGNVLTGRAVTWTTSASSVAIVSATGLVTGVAPGGATITASSEGVSGTSAITVTVAPVATVTVSPATASVGVGSSVQLSAVARDAAGNTLSGRSFTWSSGNAGVASVSGAGLVTGVSAGGATITATSEGVPGTSAVTVTASSGSACPQLSSPPPGYCTGRVHVVTSSSPTIPVLSPGDVVVFENGVYTDTDGDGTIVMVQQGGSAAHYVTFVSRNKWGAKIDGQNNTARYGFNFAAVSYVRIEGFDIYGMGSSYAGTVAAPSASGIMIQAGGGFSQIVGNHIHNISNFCNPTIRAQTGIFIQKSNVLVEGNVIHDIGRFDPGENGCTYSGTFNKYKNSDTGIYVQSPGHSNHIIRNNILYNHRNGWGIYFYQGGPQNVKILNNTFAFGNPYWSQTHIFTDADLVDFQIRNNVFYDPAGGYAMAWDLEPLVNVVITNNVASGQLLLSGADGSPVTTLPPGMTESNNRYATDPMLVNPGTFDFHLRLGSPAIDWGMSLTDVPHDIDWRARPQGGGYDAGAYERAP
jgi:uncharacterized protein YjdB